jgi:tetratricopeptide (TPR) repeat protein
MFKWTYSLKLMVLLLFAITITACKNKKPNFDLSSIDLLRGELVLCSGDQFGDVSFSLSCNYDTREIFDLAVSLLHSFEYEEAEKAFVQVIDADPDCAMAYWGVAMSITHSLWFQADMNYLEKGSKLLELARNLPAGEREKDYLDAINAYYKDYNSVDQNTRALLYEKKMEALYEKYDDDKEAAVFYALALRASADNADKNYTKQKKSGKILEELFVEQPNHPGIAHYIIHNYDYPELAHLALPTARRYASIAPASSHAQHMPSHIFTRLGLWDESITSNLNSASSARCYAEESKMDGHWSNELHAMGYLVYAYLQKGDNENAIEQYEYMKTMQNVYPSNIFAIAYPFAAIPTRIAMENKNWQDAANLSFHESELEWEKYPWQKSLLHFGKAVGLAHIKGFSAAEKELQILKVLREDILKTGNQSSAKQVLVQITITEGLLLFLNDKQPEGIALLNEAVAMEDDVGKHGITPGKLTPAREFLGDMLLKTNKPNDALTVFEKNLSVNPNRFNGLYGAAIAAKIVGDEKKATMYFDSLIKLTKNSNSNRPELAEALSYLESKQKSL